MRHSFRKLDYQARYLVQRWALNSQRIEGDFGAVAVRVHDEARLQDPVVVAGFVRIPCAANQ